MKFWNRHSRWPLYKSMSASGSCAGEEYLPLRYNDSQLESLNLSPRLARYRKCIIVLSAIAILLLILVFVLAIVVAVDRASMLELKTGIQRQAQSTPTPGPGLNNFPSTTPGDTLSYRLVPSGPAPSESALHRFEKAAVAADNGLCSEIGRNIMIRGGNAVDAVIATNVCQGAVNAQSSGLGGGFFMTYYDRKSKSCVSINAREQAGSMAHKHMYDNDPGNSELGYLAAGVPGELHGMRHAWLQFGSKAPDVSWESLFMPTVRLLRTGFPVSGHLAYVLRHPTVAPYLKPEYGLDIYINNATGKPFKKGEILKRKVLADTLEKLARASDPIALFYETFAHTLVNESAKGGGIWKIEDFKNYRSLLDRTPIVLTINEQDVVCGVPPPASGVVVASIMRILEYFNMKYRDISSDIGTAVLSYHRIIEAFKFAYAARGGLGDPNDTVHGKEIMNLVKNITSDWWADEVFHQIKNYSLPEEAYWATAGQVPDAGTTHISVVDAEGNAAALTSSVNSYFGCRRRSPTLGIVLNNQMDDFSQPAHSNQFGLPPSPENYISPGKRPQSSMAPTIVFQRRSGEVRIVLGAAGGSRIISSIVQVATRYLSFNQTVKEAVDAPRLHNQLSPYVTYYESGFTKELVDQLSTQYGQLMVQDHPREISAITAIAKTPDGTLSVNCDHRKSGGYPAGF